MASLTLEEIIDQLEILGIGNDPIECFENAADYLDYSRLSMNQNVQVMHIHH